MRHFDLPTHVNLAQTYASDIAFKVEQYRKHHRYTGKLYLAGDAWRAIQPVHLNPFNSHHFGQLSYIFVTTEDHSLIASNCDILIDTDDGRVIYAPSYTDIATHENDFKAFITTDVIISYHLDQTIQKASLGNRNFIDRLAGMLLSYRIPLLGIHKKLDHDTAKHVYALSHDSKYVALLIELGYRGLSPDYLSSLMHCALLTIKDARKQESTEQLNRVIDGHLQTIKTLTEAKQQANAKPPTTDADRDARIAALEKELKAEQDYSDTLRTRQLEIVHEYEEKFMPLTDALMKINDELVEENNALKQKANALYDDRKSLESYIPRLENQLAQAQEESQAQKEAQQSTKNKNKMLTQENIAAIKQRDDATTDAHQKTAALNTALEEVKKVKAELVMAYAVQKQMHHAQKPKADQGTQTNTVDTMTSITQTEWMEDNAATPLSEKTVSPTSDAIGTPYKKDKKKKNNKPKETGGSSSSSGTVFETQQFSVPPSPISTSTANPLISAISITNHGNTMELMLDAPFSPIQTKPYIFKPGDQYKQAVVTYVTIEMPAKHAGKSVDLSTEMINMVERMKTTPPTEPIQKLMQIIPGLPDVNASMIFTSLVICYIAQLSALKGPMNTHALQQLICKLDQYYTSLCLSSPFHPNVSERLKHHEGALNLIQDGQDAIEEGAQPRAAAALVLFRSGEGKTRREILKALLIQDKKGANVYF